MPVNRRKRWPCLPIGCLASCVACLMACGFLGFLDPFFEAAASHPFDSSLWKTGSLRQRGRMARDLESNDKLIGLSREEVVAMLGAPDHEDPDSVAYMVDIGYRFVFDPWMYRLEIRFGKVSKRVEQVSLQD